MRLDGLGKPPILTVVPEPKKTVGDEEARANIVQVKKVADAPESFVSSQGGEKLGQIIEILNKAKRENSKKKKKNPKASLQAIEEYKRVENNFHREWHLGQKQRGDKLDIKG